MNTVVFARTLINGSFEQRLPLLEVRCISSKQQPFVGHLLLQHRLTQNGKDLLFLCQTLLYEIISQLELI